MKDGMDLVLDGDLPASLQEIADVIGREGALKLVKELGGTRVFVGRRMKPNHKLAILLGHGPALKLSQMFGGETLTVVRGATLLRRARNREIIKRYDSGEGVRSLARRFTLTERQIYAVLSTPQ
ncbi:MAG: hypothetical protein H7839_08965 [Magnetococcus sp. YQC-5]